MAYEFRITFPGNQRVTLCAATENESDDMERALSALNADYVLVAPNWIGGSFQMTPAAHEALDRLAPLQRRNTTPLIGDVLRKCALDCFAGVIGVDRDAIPQPDSV